MYLATFSNHLNVYGLLPRPSLAIGLSNTNLIISWTTNFSTGYILQTTTNLSGNWLNVTDSVTTVGWTNEVTIPGTKATTFFRLKLKLNQSGLISG